MYFQLRDFGHWTLPL